MRRRRWRPLLRRTLRGLAFLAVAVWSLFPILFVVPSSFRPPAPIFAVPPQFMVPPTTQNYIELARLWPDFFGSLINSLIITLGA
ncbi:MAG: carbohydrate ABC transporter permease, partial [Elioraea tepidiphila]